MCTEGLISLAIWRFKCATHPTKNDVWIKREPFFRAGRLEIFFSQVTRVLSRNNLKQTVVVGYTIPGWFLACAQTVRSSLFGCFSIAEVASRAPSLIISEFVHDLSCCRVR